MMVKEYIPYFLIEIISSVVILCLFITKSDFRKRHTVESDRIVHIAILAAICPLLNIAYTLYYELILSAFSGAIPAWVKILGLSINVLREILCLQIMMGWNLFVDYGIYKSYDHVKRKNKKFLVWAVPLALVFMAAVVVYRTLTQGGAFRMWIFGAFMELSYLIQFILVLNAVWIVWTARSRRKPPSFLRLDFFLIPTLAGYILFYFQNSLPWFLQSDYRNVGISIAVILTWLALMRRDKYVDPKTGFYNRTFLSTMNEYMENSGYPNAVGVYFKAAGTDGQLIPVLDRVKPAEAEIFSLGEDEYLLMAGPQKKSVLRLLVKSVKLGAAEAGLTAEIESDFAIRDKGESTQDFTKRLLTSK